MKLKKIISVALSCSLIIPTCITSAYTKNDSDTLITLYYDEKIALEDKIKELENQQLISEVENKVLKKINKQKVNDIKELKKQNTNLQQKLSKQNSTSFSL